MLRTQKYFIPKIIILLVVTITAILIVGQLPAIKQDVLFHNFADNHSLQNIPNFWNVVSNIGFLIVGCVGISRVLQSVADLKVTITFCTLFLAVFFIGIGSGYYHLHPDNQHLVFDRIPMTLVFMSFLSAAIAQCINKFWGFVLLFPLLCIGMGSVLWWQYTETIGAGDLRYYGLVQFLPMLLVPLIFLLFPSVENRKIWPQFCWIIGWYVVAKIMEHYDAEIFHATKIISGHSLKHIAASIATIYFIPIFKTTAKFRGM